MAKRLDLKVGYTCNNNCKFCVQADNKYKGNRSAKEIKKDMQDSRKRCDSIVFTGGEPTIRKDILELVSYARNLGYSSIQIQTNGRALSYMNLCKEFIKAGATEFSPALHGHKAELHDSLTQSKGSFYQTVQAINNLKRLKQKVMTNTVVVRQNYPHLPKISRLLVKLNVDQFQFAFVHPIGNAMKNFNEVVPKMSEAMPHILKGLEIGIKNKVAVMTEAIPYCMMKGYGKYIAENIIPETEIKSAAEADYNFKKTRTTKGKTKFPQCIQCKYDNICEGPWKEYPERMGNKEFRAVR